MNIYVQNGVGTWTYDKNGVIKKFKPENNGVTRVDIPEEIGGTKITAIGMHAFFECSSLTEITIPNSVTAIGYDAFYDCSSLTKMIIPNSVTAIGSGAFCGCEALTEVEILGDIQKIGSRTFAACSALTKITIHNRLQSIGDDAFAGCSSLTETELEFLNGVQSIGESAFDECSSLKEVIIPEGVTAIGGAAFWKCSSLTKVTIPKSLRDFGKLGDMIRYGKQIDVTAFFDCPALKEIVFSEPSQIGILRQALIYSHFEFSGNREITITLNSDGIEKKVVLRSPEDINNLNINSFAVVGRSIAEANPEEPVPPMPNPAVESDLRRKRFLEALSKKPKAEKTETKPSMSPMANPELPEETK